MSLQRSLSSVARPLLSAGILILSALAWPAPGSPAPVAAGTKGPAVSAEGTPVFRPLPGPKKKNWIDDTAYFTYEFNEKPKMGMVILKLQVFTKKGDKIAPFAIQGRSDMPAMRGAHDSGDLDFKLSRRNDYLLPLNIVMPGDWEVRLTFYKGEKPVFYGSLTFHV
jgi:hypothetical protein